MLDSCISKFKFDYCKIFQYCMFNKQMMFYYKIRLSGKECIYFCLTEASKTDNMCRHEDSNYKSYGLGKMHMFYFENRNIVVNSIGCIKHHWKMVYHQGKCISLQIHYKFYFHYNLDKFQSLCWNIDLLGILSILHWQKLVYQLGISHIVVN